MPDSEIKTADRLEAIEFARKLPDLEPFLQLAGGAGVYAFEIVCDGEIIGASRIHVVQLPNGDDVEDNEEPETEGETHDDDT